MLLFKPSLKFHTIEYSEYGNKFRGAFYPKNIIGRDDGKHLPHDTSPANKLPEHSLKRR